MPGLPSSTCDAATGGGAAGAAGAASLICLVVFGQLLGSLLLDHYGVLHVRQPIDSTRVAGAVL
ncbi:DMT family transporter, partial [Pseudoxanthomonas sangjuensis]|uniref:DMT family transporter n=1 Tax=Pseudoxanthomonas sangjuensis TaxID=1503750 RepID=UPI001FE63AA3